MRSQFASLTVSTIQLLDAQGNVITDLTVDTVNIDSAGSLWFIPSGGGAPVR